MGEKSEGGVPDDYDELRREVEALRVRVADLQRAAARHQTVAPEATILAAQEELLREAERIAHVGTWTWEPPTGVVTWSDEMYRILGVDPDEVTPSVEAFYARVHPEDLPRAQENKDTSLRDGVLPLTDLRLIRPDGTVRHTTTSSILLFDDDGVVRRIVGGVLDRTDALAAEAKLRRTLHQLEEAQRFAKLGSWRFDPTTGEVEWSAGLRRIFGIAADAPADVETFRGLMLPEYRDRWLLDGQEGDTALQGGELEMPLQRPDGEIRHVRIESFVVPRADGGHELRGTILDITDDVKLRQELARSQKMEAVGRLAGGIAHDFNNLLQVIGTSMHLLEKKVGARQELEDSRRALDSASGLTRRLLALGRKARLKLVRVEPNELLEGTVDLMRRLVGDEIDLELELAPDLPDISVDPVEIERAVVNLVVNARDAMPGGGVVTVRTEAATLGDSPAVALSVTDQGGGIAEEDLPRLFEPFFTTRGEVGGTGLGLATVLGTAEQHGGTVRVQSDEGRGSTFVIVLPALPARVAERREEAPAPVTTSAPRRYRVLVVDDDPAVATVTEMLLTHLGHDAQMTTDPEEVLERWQNFGKTYDLVLCDVAMGSVRGPELVARMAEVGPPPRVLYMTGYSREAAEAKLDGAFVTKPFTVPALEAALESVMGSSAAERSSA
ncbi:MAG: PAS domain-containing protein [Deltaproteobacteria bacterium]|nr:PAS domain-containing protein [Deltaproteobacteria bacterium]